MNTQTNTNTMPNTITTLPTLSDLLRIPRSEGGHYELDESDVALLRGRIYRLNRDNGFGWRWRTSKIRVRGGASNKHGKPRKGFANTARYVLIVWRIW
jgi:hypothetical protein